MFRANQLTYPKLLIYSYYQRYITILPSAVCNKSYSKFGAKHDFLANDAIELSINMDQNLLKQWQAISDNEPDFMVNCSQLCALLMQQIDEISWCGFYWNREKMLVVGAYQGPLACTRIAYEDGVCGAAFTQRQVQIIDDVSLFEGHIACDSGSASEIAIPIVQHGQVIGVFDIDSYILKRFDHQFSVYLEKLIQHFVENTIIPKFV